MSVSQFTVYSSSDGSATKAQGVAGNLISILNACLVTGYGSKSAPSPAWTHPVATASNIASYAQGAGAGLGFVLNDAGVVTAKEATMTGWESVAGVGTPVGSGTNQFPTAAQSLTNGHVTIRKSTTADATNRDWVIFADSSTVYLFMASGDVAGLYFGAMFGDIFSLKGATDAYRCAIIGSGTDNGTTNEPFGIMSVINAATSGHFMARTFTGFGTSITIGKHGDGNKSTSTANPVGIAQAPNGPDNAYYFSPFWVHEPGSSVIRGRLRGCYQVCHPIATFSDGQVISGTGDYAGKTFQIVKTIFNNNSCVAMETSNTVETN
jgi:hypothetical protein